VGLSVRLPRQSVWPIFPGVRSFLNCRPVSQFSRDDLRRTGLCGYVESSVWNVEVSDYEDEAGRHDGGGGRGFDIF
jgi:hypothetical protein